MNSDTYRVLLVDDDPEQAEMVQEYLHLSGLFEIERAASISELWRQLVASPYDLILLDYRLPDGTGLDALDELNARGIAIPVVMVTGQGDERIAVQAIQRGAADYLQKSGDYMITLPTMIRKTVRASQLQLSMQQSLEKVRYQATLLNNVRDAVVVWDMNGCITYWSAAATVLFGWGANERLGHPVAEVYLTAFTPPIVVPKEGDTIGQHVARQYQTRNKQTIWVSSRVSALRDPVEGNRLIGYMDVSHDITKLKDTEQALRSERNFVSAVLDTVGALVVVLDRQGRIVRMNRACEQTCGYSFAEVRGKSAWDFLILPEDAEPIKSIFLEINPGCFPNEQEYRLFTRQGECRVIAWSNTAITNREGQVEYVIATGLDITRRKQMEAEIRTAQQQLAEAARLAAIGEMASGIAHQINNPLTTIIADAQILLRNLPPGNPGRDSAEAIEQAGWRMQTAVQRLQEFSRPAAVRRETVIINTSLQRALSLVREHIEASGIRLKTKLDDSLPAIQGNRRQLDNLWVNLLLQASQACAGGDTILLVSRMALPDRIQVEVRDNGVAIPADQLDSIFEPNFAGANGRRGTDLELSVCRERVWQHGGQIEVESTPDHDTIFRVTFPLNGSVNHSE